MMIINIDIETRSAADLFSTGGFRYAEDPSTQILCYAYKMNDLRAVSVVGHWVPHELRDAINDGATIRGWNIGGFDVPVWNQIFGHECFIHVDQIDDTMDRARATGIPGALDKAAKFMMLDIHKDMEGHALMKKLCKAHNPEPTDEEMARLAAYCQQDVEVEAKLANLIPPLTEVEEQIMRLSHKINYRGILVDTILAEKAVQYADQEMISLSGRLQEITDGKVLRHTQRAKLFDWLNERGCNLPNLQKQTLIAALEGEHDKECIEAIDIRLSGAKASTAKFKAALDMACRDDRVRGTFVYYGAPATGRWSGRGIQPHNLPRETADNVEEVLTKIADGAVPSVYKALSTLLRPMIMAQPGYTLARCDFSAIEGRVVAWLADDKDTLKEYRGEGKVYEKAASGIFKVPKDKVDKTERQIGKVAELALNFGGGWRAFEGMAMNYALDLTYLDTKGIVKAWRRSRPAITALWKEVENAAELAFRSPGKKINCCKKKVYFVFDPATYNLWVHLPMGRFICLPGFQVEYEDGPFGTQTVMSYKRGNWYPKVGDKAWPRCKTYGGSLVESLAQGIARDLLSHAMLVLDSKWNVVMHVHDEVVIEVSQLEAEDCLRDMVNVMSSPPKWATGLPLAAVGEFNDRFGK